MRNVYNNEFVRKGLCYVKCQPNSWDDVNIFKYCLKNICCINSILNHRVKNSLLIIDRATIHFLKDLNLLFKSFDSHFLLISPGLTRYLQPPDMAINKPVKHTMKNLDCQFRIQTEKQLSPTDEK